VHFSIGTGLPRHLFPDEGFVPRRGALSAREHEENVALEAPRNRTVLEASQMNIFGTRTARKTLVGEIFDIFWLGNSAGKLVDPIYLLFPQYGGIF
jgi:hypothetical protein